MANENIQELKFQVGEVWKGVYSSSTPYGLANVVQDPTGLSVYRSLKSGNVGHPLSDASWWFCIIDMSSIKDESDRIKALNQAIADDEALRVAAEELRQQHETERIAAETQRNEAEQTRIIAEQQRVSAESARATAEQQRITAEQERVSAESARVQAEQARVLSETLRANAEDQRAANEQNRIAAEQQRIERAESDHQRVESDLADMAVYNDSLGAFDLSKHNAVDGVLATYADLSAALTALNALDSKYKYGGMSFKFVLSSDNKYVQYRLMADEFSIVVADWQGVDEGPTAGSKNIITSGAVYPIKQKAEEVYNTIIEEEEVTSQISVPSRYEDGTRQWNVSSETGEFVSSSSTNCKAFEIQLESDIKTISYMATQFRSNRGYAFLDDNDNLILGVKTTSNAIIEIDTIVPIAQGATKFRFGTLNSRENIDITIVKINKYNLFEELSGDVEELQQNVVQNNSEINTLKGAVFEEVQVTSTESINAPVHEENSSKKWNVDSDTGAFVSTNADIRAIELALTSNVLEITYYAWTYSANRGYAFLDDNDNLILGVHTTTSGDLTIDTTGPISQGATKFRCGTNNHRDTYIKVKVKKLISKQTVNRIERLENEVTVKEPYTAETIQITFDTTREIPNNILGQNDVDAVTFESHTGYGLLGLANNYQPTGKPSKLAVFFMGSGSYSNHSATEFPESMKPYIDFMRKSGYTVLCPYAWDETTNYHAFATPYSIGNFNKAVKHVIEKYNVEDDGIYVWGRSAGGSDVVTFAYNSGIKIKAIALQHALIGSIVWEHNVSATGDGMVKKYIFDNDANYDWTEQYLTDNYYKIAPFENMFNGLVDSDISIADKVQFLLGTYIVNTWKGYKRNLPFPCKMWAAADDGNVPYNNILIFHQQVINGGGYCEFRQLPSNYTDEEVTTANPHHVVDYAGPRSTVTTKLGYTVETSNGYIELVEWFDRF